MSVITKNLPWFVKDLGVSIVGEKCYISLVEDLHLSDVPCLKYALSKGLGVGIVVGGSVMKVPQILLIINASSARGLSLPSYILETLSYGITLAYSVRNAFPFSTYGENLFLSIQNVFITFLIILYSPRKKNKAQQFVATAVTTAVTGFVLANVGMDKLAVLQAATLPLSLSSKLPQIMQNYRSKSTGQLSAFAVISQILGCLARVFTTLQEVNDPLVLLSFILALFLNLVLGTQLYLFWDNTAREARGDTNKIDVTHELKELGNGSGRRGGAAVSSAIESASISARGASEGLSSVSSSSVSEKVSGVYGGEARSPPQRVSTPPIRSGTPTGRKWSRKVD